jgi:hypothetical protein
MPETYGPPDALPADMTADAAKAALDTLSAGSVTDPRHPLGDTTHALHRAYTEHFTRLATVVAEAQAQAQAARDAQAVDNFLQRDGRSPEAQANLEAEAVKEVELLNKLGIEGEAPADCQPYQLAALKMQRLAVEGDYENLAPIMEQELRTLNANAETVALLQSYMRVKDVDSTLRDEITERLISWIHRAGAERHKASKLNIGADVK